MPTFVHTGANISLLLHWRTATRANVLAAESWDCFAVLYFGSIALLDRKGVWTGVPQRSAFAEGDSKVCCTCWSSCMHLESLADIEHPTKPLQWDAIDLNDSIRCDSTNPRPSSQQSSVSATKASRPSHFFDWWIVVCVFAGWCKPRPGSSSSIKWFADKF